MPNRTVNRKVLDVAPNPQKKEAGEWMRLAEDAERDAAKARERSKQLAEAARIFRQNAESGTLFPQLDNHDSEQQPKQAESQTSEPCHTT
jgi:hypothetical protein